MNPFLEERTGARLVVGVALAAALAGCEEHVATPEKTTPLEVTATVPVNGGVLAPGDSVRVTFNKDVDPTTVEGGVQVIGVAATVTYDAASRTATLTPKEPWTPGRAYTLVVARVAGVDGSRLAGVFTLSFTVRA